MTDNEAEPPFLPAATVLLLKDGPEGLQVFMVARHVDVASFSGALVFPGGKVDARDAVADLLALCPGDAADPLLPFRIAAVREAFEECGVLLARRTGAELVLPAAELAPVEQRWRGAIDRGETDMLTMCRAEGLVPATDLLVRFGHWITPKGQPKIFDTHFFLAPAPADQVALHDGRETTDSLWIEPARALADAEAGRRNVVFPTRMNLRKLARAAASAQAFAEAERDTVVTVRPRPERHAEGRLLNIPAEAGYGVTRILATRDGRFLEVATDA